MSRKTVQTQIERFECDGCGRTKDSSDGVPAGWSTLVVDIDQFPGPGQEKAASRIHEQGGRHHCAAGCRATDEFLRNALDEAELVGLRLRVFFNPARG